MWQGAPDGQPVLVLHGYTMANAVSPEAERVFRDAGYRLLVVSRPGFGASEYDQGRDAGEESADAIVGLCQHLGLTDTPALAISTGMVPLAAVLARQPHLVRSIVMTGHLFLGEVSLNPQLSFYQRLMLNLMRRAPRVQSTFSRIAYRNMQRVGVDWYIERLIEAGSSDEAYFRSGQNADLVRAAASHLFAQGPDVFSRELRIDRSPGVSLMRDSRYPLLALVQGENAVHGFKSYRDFLNLGSHTRIEELVGHGDLYFYSAGEQIARMAVDHFAASS
ncbi:alpha/beta hydrolase [Alteriqipengyuania flavescens]|uniref:alpha/beta fold hydrolase n=1 Tax=Alteriqipengyuania flavescens TaxID=3053610 RepID=UPI0025B3B7DA|nr:alpha/beta hydrolase [Alteriqipengyuania flavescens]WJY18977.1 alpha/beta hydrolase [Alteriqipengyuania flavescens]WJY24917.1 alpha/beta hydrolase [Alteriqipengyuania flavescens]